MDEAFEMESRNHTEGTRLIITAAESLVPKYLRLIQSGFMVKAVTGVSIKSFLCRQMGLSEDYFEERIQTLFLDSKPVDDVTATCIADGSRLALSAAMPGVAGALFRKGGRYSAMRKGISYKPHDVISDEEVGWVTIKLFNLILKELGPFFLSKGVWIDGSVVQEFFRQSPQSLLDSIQRIEKNGSNMETAEISTVEWSAKRILLRIESGLV